MLIILDKDGTLTEPASGSEFVQSPEDQRLLPRVADRIAELKAIGATLVIASNQGGVAAGHKTLKDAIAEMKFCLKLLPQITEGYFCPDFEGLECWCINRSSTNKIAWKGYPINATNPQHNFRKPNPGMLKYARIIYTRPNNNAIMIGDRPEDRQAAAAAGITFVDAEAWRTSKVVIAPGALIA